MITLCLILRDNPERVRSFLEEIKSCVDEIVVLDFSSDPVAAATVRGYTERVFVKADPQPWEMNLQYAIDQAQCPWILLLDVLERLDANLKNGLRQLIRSGRDAYWIPIRDVGPDGTVSEPVQEYELRFFRKGQVEWPGPGKDPEIRTGSAAKVEGAYILRRPRAAFCRAALQITSGFRITRLEKTLRSGQGEEPFDLGLLLEMVEKENPVMDTEEAFVRFLHELSRE
jgi:hypothetical protein